MLLMIEYSKGMKSAYKFMESLKRAPNFKTASDNIPSLLFRSEVNVDHEGGGVPRRHLGRFRGFAALRLFNVLDDVADVADGLGGHLTTCKVNYPFC